MKPCKGRIPPPYWCAIHADDSQRGGRRRAPLTEMFRIFSINISTNIFPSSPLGWNARIGFKRHYFRTSAHQPKKSCVRKGHGTSRVLLHSIPRAKCGTKEASAAVLRPFPLFRSLPSKSFQGISPMTYNS